MTADDIEEKRVFGDRAGGNELLVACALGLLSVDVSADRVGRFGVTHRCHPADVAAGGGRVAVATDEDVLFRARDGDEFEPTGFGPAAVVGFDDDAPVAASPDGRLARLDPDETDHGWTDLGRLDGEVRAIDGRLVATGDGVYRLPGLDYAGLDDVRDVAAAGPLAATGDGLYALGNGWMGELEGAFRVAAAGDRAHAATAEAFYERGSSSWREVALPTAAPPVDVAYGEVPYGITANGAVLAAGEAGWRAHPLGVDDAVACAVA